MREERHAIAGLFQFDRPISRAISTVEPVLRLSHGRVDDGPGRAGGTLITPGLNVYFGGLNRVMFNYDVWSPRGDGDVERSFKAMFQLAF